MTKAKQLAADAAKWRAVEPLVIEAVQAQDAREKLADRDHAMSDEWRADERSFAAMDKLIAALRSLLAENVNQGLTKEPR